jgi:hypothetical protein
MTSSPRAQKRVRTLVARALPLAVPALLLVAPRLAEAQPQAAVEARERGRAALAAGDVAKACIELEGALGAVPQGDPTRDEFLFELADCHAKQGKNLLAASEFDQIAQGTGPKAADAKVRADAIRNPPPPTPPTPPTPPAPPGAEPPKAEGPPKEGDKKDEKANGDKKDDEKKRSFRLSDFMDTRLTWVFGDDDVLHQTGQAFPLSPDASIGDRRQYRLFFDNLNSRFAGRENLTHLVLYKKMPSFLKNLDTEASMVLRFDIGALARNTNNVNQALYDAGSYIRLFYHTDKQPEGTEGVGLTLYVLDTDRMRLGWLYDISWGGTNPFINQSIFPRIQGASPGLKLSYDHKVFNVWAGAKTAQIIQVEETLTPGTSEVEQIRVGQTNFGVLGGVGANFGEYVSLDVGGGFFQQGKFDLPDVEGKPVWTGGVSARLHAHHPEAKAAQSIDFLLYRNDPMKQQVFFRPEKYTPGKTTWAASAEFTSLFQHLKDFDVAGATKVQPAIAGALQALIKSGYFRGQPHGHLPRPAVRGAQPAGLHPLPDAAQRLADPERALLRGRGRLPHPGHPPHPGARRGPAVPRVVQDGLDRRVERAHRAQRGGARAGQHRHLADQPAAGADHSGALLAAARHQRLHRGHGLGAVHPRQQRHVRRAKPRRGHGGAADLRLARLLRLRHVGAGALLDRATSP